MGLIIHHLQVSQSERLPWICEELGIDYELKLYKRAPLLAPPEYKALHPMGSAPVIQDGDVTLAESCACIEDICHKYGQGRLFLHSSDPEYADFLYWWHWVDGSFTSTLSQAVVPKSDKPVDNSLLARYKTERYKNAIQMLEDRLGKNTWLAGSQFTAADVMLVFHLTTLRYFYPFELGAYPNILSYLARIGARPAYQAAMKKCDPEMELVLGASPPKSDKVL
ncbi:glutathione s-transferase [Grosmannia clavigera kw1407]|uniref:Glutathione s-transferase n=1 Tax=Grosmannia clavigera (strain kw1407 / UAMH 11150) TaxID=655863 RepID=F0X925_GROCL|nr:glutathione s-transferase [Grosmannia clavigera kw1407]EFX05913.1 glutathione s-transferase [Grosmannia clavigera kw1407]